MEQQPNSEDVCRAAHDLRWLDFCHRHYGVEPLTPEECNMVFETEAHSERILASAGLSSLNLVPWEFPTIEIADSDTPVVPDLPE